ncbi:MAG: hypothetical protein JXB62_05875 [Pirellulales bacterium]|nr:hypothetical protein [Pirellulales bacterium]
MSVADPHTAEYRCPGQPYPISRSVHLGRMARFYPGCRQCPHRDETGPLSRRQIAQLVETRPRGSPATLFHDEGTEGVYGNDLGPDAAREMAAALGTGLRGCFAGKHQPPQRAPQVVIAGDGRPLSCELVAAAAEGLRWAGCDVTDVGVASAPCLAFAIEHLGADGGLLVGNRDGRPHTVGLKFWAGPRPLSAQGPLDLLRETHRAGVDRPTRRFGSLRRFRAEEPYVASLAEHYHALRPLRFVLDSSCGPLSRFLERLLRPVACRVIPSREAEGRLPEQVVADGAHFAIRIGDDGETCGLFDEQGRRVAVERLLLRVAGHLVTERSPQTVVLETGTDLATARRIEALGGQVARADTRRAAMERAMREQGAIFGGGPSGRFWYADGGLALPDALRTLTLLLVVLSQSDRRLSEVLDGASAAG